MINVDETDLTLSQAIERHGMVTRAMEQLVETEGWRMISAHLEQTVRTLKAQMRSPGLKGEQALSICAGIVSAETILETPGHLITTSADRVKQLEQEQSESSKKLTHHREGQLRGRTPKKESKD